MQSKAQAGLEYLMAYGWVLILVATIVGTIVFIVGEPIEETTFSSSDPTKIMVKGGTVSDGTTRIKLQNITGGNITISQLAGTGYSNCSISPTNVPAGGEIEITCDAAGKEQEGSVLIDYTDYSGLEKTTRIRGRHSGTATIGPIANLTVDEIWDGGPGSVCISGMGCTPRPGAENDVINTPTNFDFTEGCSGGSCLNYRVHFIDGDFAGQEFEIMEVFQGAECVVLSKYDPKHSCARLDGFNGVQCINLIECLRPLDPAWNFNILEP